MFKYHFVNLANVARDTGSEIGSLPAPRSAPVHHGDRRRGVVRPDAAPLRDSDVSGRTRLQVSGVSGRHVPRYVHRRLCRTDHCWRHDQDLCRLLARVGHILAAAAVVGTLLPSKSQHYTQQSTNHLSII